MKCPRCTGVSMVIYTSTDRKRSALICPKCHRDLAGRIRIDYIRQEEKDEI